MAILTGCSDSKISITSGNMPQDSVCSCNYDCDSGVLWHRGGDDHTTMQVMGTDNKLVECTNGK